jgi:curli biogenesis system outer membrane secretion channel CsgG
VQVAVDRAIRLAFEQVNGKSFDAATLGIDAGITGQIDDRSFQASSSGFADLVYTETHGAVSEFRLLSQNEADGMVEVLIEASVEKFVKPESASQLRVAISPLHLDRRSFTIGDKSVPSSKVAQQITDDISEALLRSKRVTVLDRNFDSEVQKELNRIDAGNWKNEDRLRLGQQLAADFLVVGRLDRFEYTKHVRKLRTSDKQIISYSGGASLLIRVVNVATGQIQVAETFDVELPQTKPTSMGRSVDTEQIVADLVQSLTDSATQQITLSLFPITVVDVDGEDIVLSQGGDMVKEGRVYQIILRGKEIKDPQTGRVIGRIEKPCCTVLVTTVTEEMSYGVIKDKQIADVAAVFAPGALELRGALAPEPAARSAERLQPALAQVATSPPETPTTALSVDADGNPDPDKDEGW